MNLISLSPVDLSLAALLVLALAGFSWWLRLGMERRRLGAALRTTGQARLVAVRL